MRALEYLTIRPPARYTNLDLWRDTFPKFPAFPHLKELAIVYHYSGYSAFDRSFWIYLDLVFKQEGVFPQSMEVDIRATFRSARPRSQWQRNLFFALPSLSRNRVVKFWGGREWGLF